MLDFNSANSFIVKVNLISSLNNFKPKLFLKLIGGYFRNAFGKSSPRTLGIALNYECNFNCNHCSATTLIKTDSLLLTAKEYSQISNNAQKLGILFFHFTGGEPLINRKRLFQTIKLFNPEENLISIQTNGWYIDQQFLEEYKKIKGDFLCVSMDSTDPLLHDDFRKQIGSWHKALEAIKLSRKNKIKTLISYTLTHENFNNNDFKKMIHLSKQLGVYLFVVFATPSGKWENNRDHLLTDEDKIEFNKLTKEYSHIRTDRDSNWGGNKCPALKEALYLTPYGDILPCPFIQLSFGNVRNNSLEEIYKQVVRHPCLKKRESGCIASDAIDVRKYFQQ